MTTIALWSARLLSLGLILLIGLFAFAEGLPRPSSLMPIEMLAFAAKGLMLAGLALAWRWPGAGGILILCGYFSFWFVSGSRSAMMPVFALFGLTGLLFLAAWWGKGRQDLRAAVLLLAIAALSGAGGWWRLGAGSHDLDRQFAALPDWTGKWTGTAYVSDSRVRREPLPIELEVLEGPMFRGRIGEAAILGGDRSRKLHGRLGYLQRVLGEPAYAVRLTLDRAPVSKSRGGAPEATLCLDRRPGGLVGAVHTLDRPEDLRDLKLVLAPSRE